MTPEKHAKRHPHCGVLGHGPATRFPEADAYACLQCDEWLEGACDDPECMFCSDRTERPSGTTEPAP